MSYEELEKEAMRLSIEDRAALAEKLLLSVDAPSDAARYYETKSAGLGFVF